MPEDRPDQLIVNRNPQTSSIGPDGLIADSTTRESIPTKYAGWAELLLDAEEQVLRLIGAGKPSGEVLDAICLMVEAFCTGASVAVLGLDPRAPVLRFSSGPTLTDALRDAIATVPVASGTGAIGRSAAGGRSVIDERLEDAGSSATDSALRSAGLRSCWAWPIRSSESQVLGVVCVLLPEPRSPEPPEARVADRAAVLAAIVFERLGGESASRDDQQRLQMALEAGRMGTWDWDIRTGLVRWSDNVATIHGLPAGDFDGTMEGFQSLVHPEDRAMVKEAIDRSIMQRSNYEVEFRTIRPDGAILWLLGEGLVFVDEDDTPIRMMGLVTDVTERKRAEVELRESRELFRDLADSIPQLAWMARPDGYLFWFNKRCYEFSGASFEELEGFGWAALHDPEILPRVMAGFERALRTGEPWEDTFPLRRADGTMRWQLSRAVPVRDHEGRIVRWFGTNTDISERMEMEAALREADRRKDEFLAMLAHELRNPLAPIATALDLIGREGISREIFVESRLLAERQARHLRRLIDDLMDVARINDGRITLQTSPTDLVEVVRRSVSASKGSIDQRRHRLTVELPTGPIPMIADPTRLEQVIGNLLQNAVKFTEPGGKIEVLVAREGAEAVVVVRDSGVGIDPGHLTRIFDLFIQSEIRRAQSSGGLGIGLSLVKSLVELHGGTVEARSEGKGSGSTFVVRLPVAESIETSDPVIDSNAGSDSRPIEPPGDRRRILIVDDNEDAATVLARLLQRVFGHDVLVAHDGPGALDAARSFSPQVVLLDIGLPGIDGFEVARRLRLRPESKGALIVALTGWGNERDRQRSREAGIDHHLVKPAPLDQIARLIAEDSRARS